MTVVRVLIKFAGIRRQFIPGLLITSIWPTSSYAANLDSGDTAWVLTSTALVLLMAIPALALFYGGLVRVRNVLSLLMHCFVITCAASIVWFIGGYSLVFTDGGSHQAFLGGFSRFFLLGLTAKSQHGTLPEAVFVMFQLTFAAITPALIVGAFAERMRFSAMLLFSMGWLVLSYIPVAHWVWGNGWLMQLGTLDFAGGIVVHVNAGTAALVAALVIGRRRGFPQKPMPPHSLVLAYTGAAMLWVGWFGFNAGSALAANGSAAMALLTTHLAASSGALVWMSIEWVKFGKPSVLGTATGMVAGLGTITAAAGFVGPAAAVGIGGVAGWCCFWATQYIKNHLHIDDSLDVFSVHGVGGILGSLLTGILVANQFGGSGLVDGMTIGRQVQVQALAIVITALWSGLVTVILLKLVDLVVGLRVNEEEETEGLDIVFHEERGYNL